VLYDTDWHADDGQGVSRGIRCKIRAIIVDECGISEEKATEEAEKMLRFAISSRLPSGSKQSHKLKALTRRK